MTSAGRGRDTERWRKYTEVSGQHSSSRWGLFRIRSVLKSELVLEWCCRHRSPLGPDPGQKSQVLNTNTTAPTPGSQLWEGQITQTAWLERASASLAKKTSQSLLDPTPEMKVGNGCSLPRKADGLPALTRRATVLHCTVGGRAYVKH